jgi:hypothetical protein
MAYVLDESDMWSKEGKHMRTVAALIFVSLFPIYQTAAAQQSSLQESAPEASSSHAESSTKREGMADAERKKADDVEKARQRKLDRLSKSICTGC